jgi:Ca2+-binding EF-hand superfamily protein
MKQRYSPVLIGAGLLVSGSIITGLANANMGDALHKRYKFMAKKLDINNDGMVSLEELTSHQDKRLQMLDLKADGMIDKTKFNGRIVAMFQNMDSNGDGSLDDKEIRKMKRYDYGKM